MILEPLVDNSLQFEFQNKESEKKISEEKGFIPKENSKRERILSKREEIFSLNKKAKEKNSIKINLYFVILLIFLIGIVTGSIAFRLFIEDISVKEIIVEKFNILENQELTHDEIFKD